MKVTFSPANYQPTGIVSFASWSDHTLLDAIRESFRESPRERIVELIIECDGIKAVFEKR